MPAKKPLYDRLVDHYKNGRHREYIEEIKSELQIKDEKKKENLANSLLKLHRKIVENHSEFVISNYGESFRDIIHTTMKGIIDHIDLLNKTNPEALESDFLHKPIWNNKSILDLMAERVSKSPQAEYSRLIHISGTLVNHYKEVSESPTIHRMYAAALARGDDKVLKYINVALSIIKNEKPKSIKKYLNSFDEILKNKGVIQGSEIRINKKNVGNISKILLLLAAHSVIGKKRIPKTEEELLYQIAEKIIPKEKELWDESLIKEGRARLIERAKSKLKDDIGMFTSYVLMNKSLSQPDILPKTINLPEIPYKEKDALMNKFSSLILHHMVGKEKEWIKEHIDEDGRLHFGKLWNIIKKHEVNIDVGKNRYKLVFDKLDPIGQINAIEKLQSCYTPPNEAAFHALSFILNPYKTAELPARKVHSLVPGIVRVFDKNGKLVGRFTLMIHVTPSKKIRLMVTSLPNGYFPRGIIEDFVRSFRDKIEKEMPNSTLPPVITDKKEMKNAHKIRFLFGELHDDGLVIEKKQKKSRVYIVGRYLE